MTDEASKGCASSGSLLQRRAGRRTQNSPRAHRLQPAPTRSTANHATDAEENLRECSTTHVRRLLKRRSSGFFRTLVHGSKGALLSPFYATRRKDDTGSSNVSGTYKEKATQTKSSGVCHYSWGMLGGSSATFFSQRYPAYVNQQATYRHHLHQQLTSSADALCGICNGQPESCWSALSANHHHSLGRLRRSRATQADADGGHSMTNLSSSSSCSSAGVPPTSAHAGLPRCGCRTPFSGVRHSLTLPARLDAAAAPLLGVSPSTEVDWSLTTGRDRHLYQRPVVHGTTYWSTPLAVWTPRRSLSSAYSAPAGGKDSGRMSPSLSSSFDSLDCQHDDTNFGPCSRSFISLYRQKVDPLMKELLRYPWGRDSLWLMIFVLIASMLILIGYIITMVVPTLILAMALAIAKSLVLRRRETVFHLRRLAVIARDSLFTNEFIQWLRCLSLKLINRGLQLILPSALAHQNAAKPALVSNP